MRKFALTAGALALICSAHPLSVAALASDSTDTLVEQCHVQLQMGDAGCKCIGDLAAEQLDETQQKFVVAMVLRDQAAMTDLQGQMTQEQEDGANQFFERAPNTCAAQQ